MSTHNELYSQWAEEQTPEALGKVLTALDPVLVSEVQNYNGPKKVLHSKARNLAIGAIKTYDPTKGANLRTWVSSQLRPLSRYSMALEPVKAPELAKRKAAEISRVNEEIHDRLGRYPTDTELADEVGISLKRLNKVRNMTGYTTTESGYLESGSDDGEANMPDIVQNSSSNYAMDSVYTSLDPREKVIMDWKTGRNGKEMLSNAEIAKRLGVSPAFVSQVSSSIAERVTQVMQSGI